MLRKGLSRPYVALVLAVVALIVSAAVIVPLTFGRSTLTVTNSTTVTSTTTVTYSFATTSTVTPSTVTVTLGPPVPIDGLETFSITLGGNPGPIGVDPEVQTTNGPGTIYVVDRSSGNLSVVSDYAQKRLSTIQLPGVSYRGIAIDNSTHMVYLSVPGGIVEINGTTEQIVGELPETLGYLGTGYGPLAYDQSTKVIYSYINSTLIGIDVQTGSVVLRVPLEHYPDYPVSLAVDPRTDSVIVAGCADVSSTIEFCNSVAYLFNGTTGGLIANVTLGGEATPTVVTVNPTHHLFYVAGATLAAINDTNGKVVFKVNPQECGPFISMVYVSNTDQVAAVGPYYNYTFVYDGATGALLDMYSLPNSPRYVAYVSLTNELLVTLPSQMVAFRNTAGPGYMDPAAIGSGQKYCNFP